MTQNMQAIDYLKYIANVIHTTIVATVDDAGLPVTAAIDMMDADAHGLYFLTAKGKNVYNRLVKRQYLALTAIKGQSTMTSIAVSIRGKVKVIGATYLSRLLDKNKYMYEIYPTEESRKALTVFQIYEGAGEWFDLSKKPIERASFVFGGADELKEGYFITENCIGCGTCIDACPQHCINSENIPYQIEQEHCLHCGNCMDACPNQAIQKR